jgi:hypothetical protein
MQHPQARRNRQDRELALTEALLAQPSLPRQVKRLLPEASAKKQNATPPVYLSTPELGTPRP